MKRIAIIAAACLASSAGWGQTTSTVNTPSGSGSGSLTAGRPVQASGVHTLIAAPWGERSVTHATVTANASVDTTAQVWPCDATLGAVTMTLPLGSTVADQIYKFKKVDPTINPCVVTVSAGDTIDGSTLAYLILKNQAVDIKNDGGASVWDIY